MLGDMFAFFRMASFLINPFQANAPFLYPLKTSEKPTVLAFSNDKEIEHSPEIDKELLLDIVS